ncbi:MAG: bifunctional (p)ppGpp synthetase/guanosine-3',5'-bis(diphosphate) 3'-pyrophosphohydrolase [Calditrichaeota bacterium]|nr:bifunctional (p)ppGpp synthetase/guanosine-3',5'-bis(diphosphate) 3'-pyrophosphohydrolase [Calditrichota bacterium]
MGLTNQETMSAIPIKDSDEIERILGHPYYEKAEPQHVEAFRDIIRMMISNRPETDTSLLDRAFRFAYEAHRGHFRLSGEPYIVHVIEVARLLAEIGMDDTTVAAGLLHDAVEDRPVTLDDLRKEFGETVAMLVDGVTKIPELKYESTEEKQASNFHKMLLSMSRDLRVILIKFADRIHNMQTISHLPRKAQERIALETRDVYAPLAHRLGVGRLRWELEDLAFRVLEPRAYRELAQRITLKREEREAIVTELIPPIKKELDRLGIKARISGRVKHLYSIHNKIRVRGVSFDDILDLIAIRIIVQEVKDCYFTLGIVHSLFMPIQDKFTDYIATPKTNGYQSLHTSVFAPDGRKVEVQIRTEEMDRNAEYGIAAHWRYKEGAPHSEDLDRQMAWIRQLLDTQAEGSGEFLENLKIDLFQDEIFVFTPRGKLITLPRRATPVDFAFAVHSGIGLHAMAAKVNGQIVPLSHPLKSGDVVEIITSANQRPNLDWLKFVVTTRARSKIKRWLKEQHYEESIRLGKEIIQRELGKMHLRKSEKELEEVAHSFGHGELSAFYAAVGSGDIALPNILRKLIPSDQPEVAESLLTRVLRKGKSTPTGVRIHGLENVAVNFGRCCQPLPGDRITGFITMGRGISVHRLDCPNISELMRQPQRNIPVEWDVERDTHFNVRVRIMAEDRKNLLRDITEAIASQDVNIISLEMKKEDAVSVGHMVLEVKSLPHLTRIMRRIMSIRNIFHVERIGEDITNQEEK